MTGYGIALDRPDFGRIGSLEEGLDLLATLKGGDGWLLGVGVPVALWGPERLKASVLDRIFPDRPVLLKSQDMHSVWVNSRVLQLAGITRDTPDPQGGRIGRDLGGNPDGLLFESATDLVQAIVPEPGPAELRAALDAAARELAAMGVTSVHHMAAEPASQWQALASRASEADYPLRVWACIPQEDLEAAQAVGLATGQGGSGFQIGGAKFFIDGALGSGTAWFIEPYSGSSDHGVTMLDPGVFRERIAKAVEAGLVPVIHAIGDAAVRETIDALEACAAAWQARGMRPRLEHAQHITKQDVARMARLGIIASMQPIHLTFDALVAERQLGSARLGQAYVFRQFLEAGVPLAFGSDTPVAPPGVFEGLAAATSRVARDGRAFQPQEATTMAEALHAYTAGAAWAIGREDVSGRLAPGFEADLVVLNRHPAGRLEDIRVLRTVKGGRITFDAGVLSGGNDE